MAELARKLTPIAAHEATALLVTALREREGDRAQRVAQHLASLVWIETGGGRKMVWHNWGNLAGEYHGDFWRPPWFIVDESSSLRMRRLHQAMQQGKAPSKFRAYHSRPEGLEDFIRLLYEPRYAPMLKAARANNTQGFADAVHTTGYCPDDACRGSNTLATYRRLKNNFAPLLGLPLEGNGPAGPILLVLLLFALAKGLRR
jgi:hypothetical protein